MELNIFAEIKGDLVMFLTGLNWTYVFLFGLITYGIKNEQEFEWYNDLLKSSKMKSWIAGGILMLFFCFFKYMSGIGFSSEYISALLRSFIVTVVLSRTVDSILISYIEKKFKDKV